MTDRPILFSGPMVRALLAGTKTQTRRVIGLTDKPMAPGQIVLMAGPRFGGTAFRFAPRYHVGDRLYAREAWSGIYAFRNTPPARRESMMTPDGPLLREDVWFWADGNPDGGDYEKPRPSRHMPRWASRITLTVTDVRVERLQDISEEDAVAEGFFLNQREIEANTRLMERETLPHIAAISGGKKYPLTVRSKFMSYWIGMYGLERWDGPDAYDNNPWVAAYTFTVALGNIDQIGRAA